MSGLIFVGGIDGKKRWLDDGKSFSRNYKQGNRVYSSEGVATALSAQPVGSAGGYTSLYLIDDSQPKGERSLTKTNEVNTEVNGKPFTYVSLFSGIGGFETALNKLGGTCVLASEIDRFANQSYEALYGHPTAGDITKIEAADVPYHDVLVGGFPCQAFSVAGKRLGFDDTRGTLFFEALRIAKLKRPKALMLENVKGLISHDKGRTLDVMTSALCEIGYTIDFNVLNSKYFGVPQNRERIFIIAVRDDLVAQSPWAIEGTNVVAKGKRRISEIDGVKTFNFDWPEQTEVTTRLRDILETEVDEKYYLSEEKTAALVAQLDKGVSVTQGISFTRKKVMGLTEISNTLQAAGPSRGLGDNNPITGIIEGIAIREATKQGYAIATEGDAVNFQFPDSKTRRGRVGKQIANTLEASNINQGVVERDVNGLNTLDDGTAYCITTRTHANYDYRGAVVKKQATLIEEHTPKYRIRKLTPLECWRLQGFTDEQHQTVVDAGLSDSQRYKQAGNAVTVNVIHAIGERLLPYLR